jgi:hypothetical protein
VALMALHPFRTEDDTVSKALAWMRQKLETVRTASELAWGGWCARTYSLDGSAALTRLQTLRQANGSWDNNPFITAIGLLAEGE